MEKILRIEETSFKKEPKNYSSFVGYQVITDKQTIRLGIDDGQSCCERSGYFWCNDKPEDFVGAKLRSISITDKALNEAKMKENDLNPNEQYFEGGVMFVNIDTTKGLLQFVAYNCHNGYYGHEAVVISNQLNKEETL